MTRLQILELPAGPDDERPPFALVVDQHQPLRYVMAEGEEPREVDEFAGLAERIGARAVVRFQETVDIPANDTTAYLAPGSEEPEALDPELVALVHEALGIELEPDGVSCGEALFRACRELQKSEASRRHLRGERDRLEAALARVRSLPERPDTMAVNPEQPYAYMDGYAAGIRAARAAVRAEEASES